MSTPSLRRLFVGLTIMNLRRSLRTCGLARVGLLALTLGCAAAREAKAEDASFKLKVEVPAAQKGVPAVARITLQPGAGYHVNKSYPTALSLAAPAGVTVEKAKLAAADAVRFEETGAQFEVKFTAAEPGQKTITGEFKFAVCSESSCDPKKEKLALVVQVK